MIEAINLPSRKTICCIIKQLIALYHIKFDGADLARLTERGNSVTLQYAIAIWNSMRFSYFCENVCAAHDILLYYTFSLHSLNFKRL